ncbi:MAG: M28 family peptidase [Planctomycetes bacterium]|nr:M28 family peptidase [Planctomycetota bacterium]
MSAIAPLRWCLLGFGLACAPLARAQDALDAGYATIEKKSVQEDLEFLAADAREGRDTGSKGLERAAEFLSQRFEALKLEPPPAEAGASASYVRPWSGEFLSPVAAACKLELVQGDQRAPLALESEWIPALRSSEKPAAGEVVWAGYAISASDHKYDDLIGVDLRGKVAVAFWLEPGMRKKGEWFDGAKPTAHADIYTKAKLVAERGAVALVLASPPLDEKATAPLGFELPHFVRASGGGGFGGGRLEEAPIPIAHLARSAAERVLGLDLEALQKRHESKRKAEKLVTDGRRLELSVDLERATLSVPNVVGVRRGSDPQRANEYVLIGAHFDHVGRRSDGEIFRGADDNASGTSALLAIARAFAEAPTKRSIVFVAFSGEEKGLIGSDAFAATPPFPLARCVAMLNLDMVGRGEKGNLQVGGTWDAPDLKKVLLEAYRKKKSGLVLDLEGGKDIWQRSDQYSFHRRGVPALFFFAGFHDDYHQPSDRVEKIDIDKLVRIAKLAYATAYLLAEAEETPRRPPAGG